MGSCISFDTLESSFLIRFVPFPKVGIVGDVVSEMLYVAENLIFSYWFI